MSVIDAPRSKAAPKRRGINWEKWGWIYMRASGVVLVVLIFGHLFVNLVAGEGVKAIDFAFVAGKWADPFWVVWDTLLLWLALIHGGNGMALDYGLADLWFVARMLKTAPVSREMVLNFVAQRSLGLPASY